MVDSEAQVRNIEAAQTSPRGDAVNHPPHYNHGGMETIDYIESLGIGFEFCVGNAIKYLSRAGYKDDIVQDLCKALWYIDRARKRSLEDFIDNLLCRVQFCVKEYIMRSKETPTLKAEDLVDSIGCGKLRPRSLIDMLGSAIIYYKGDI